MGTYMIDIRDLIYVDKKNKEKCLLVGTYIIENLTGD